MNGDHDLELNAYLDGELSDEQRREVEHMLDDDDALRRRLARLRRLKAELVHSFPLAVAGGEGASPLRRRLAFAGIAVLLVLAGFLLGVLTTGLAPGERYVLIDDGGRALRPAAVDSGETRIVFHLTNPDQVVAGEMLDEVENLLLRYRERGELLRVEIVSHGAGLPLLRQRLSEHRQRIAALARSFDNLAFVACQNTIDRLRVEKGVEVTLLPQAEIIDSGVSHVVKRQMEGWSYIRV